jgi:hypothetical protein
MKNLLIAGYVCSLVALGVLPPAFGLAGLVVGIVVLARGRVGHGIAIIVLAVTCGLVGTYTGYIGWSNLGWNSVSLQSTSSKQEPLAMDWRVVSVQGGITQQNDVYAEFAWKVTIRNESSAPGDFVGEVHFLDNDGFEVSNDVVNLDDVLIGANTEGTFTGQRSIFNEPASRIVKVTASMRKR